VGVVVVRETVVVKRRDFPPLLCAIVSCVIPWRRFVSPFRFAINRFKPKFKGYEPGLTLSDDI